MSLWSDRYFDQWKKENAVNCKICGEALDPTECYAPPGRLIKTKCDYCQKHFAKPVDKKKVDFMRKVIRLPFEE